MSKKKPPKPPAAADLEPKPNKRKTNPETGLTDQQEMFGRYYLGMDACPVFNGTQAALRAGYAKSHARQQAHDLLSKPDMQAWLAKLQAPAIRKFEVTQERIMEEVAHIAFSNILDYVTVDKDGQAYVDLSRCTREQASALAQIEIIEMPPVDMYAHGVTEPQQREVLKVKIKTWDKLNALEKLMKRHGLLKEHIVVTGRIEMTDTERARRVAFMLRSAGQRPASRKAITAAAPGIPAE